MIHQPEYIKELLKKYLEGHATPSEIAQLKAAWKLYTDDELLAMMQDGFPHMQLPQPEEPTNADVVAKDIIRRAKYELRGRRIARNRSIFKAIAYFILIIGMIFVLTLIFNRPKRFQLDCGLLPANSEIPASRFNCTLFFNNENSIRIDRTSAGHIARIDGIEITQTETGVLEYRSVSPANDSLLHASTRAYHTITTGIGQQYEIILTDGTRIRLNASSSIRIPLPFDKTERTVELDGEAYFVVPNHAAVPFIVISKNAAISSMGSRFNVNTYSLWTMVVSLGGNMSVKGQVDSHSLLPASKAIIGTIPGHSSDTIVISNKIDTTQAITWKKIDRIYSGINLKDFVTDMGKWYGLEYKNLDCVPNRAVAVGVCYNASTDDVLKLFREMGINFRFDGGKITFCKAEQ